MLKLGQRNHCFNFLMVNSVKWHNHCRRLYIMTNTMSLCLSMMIYDLSVYDMLVHIRPFFIKYVEVAIRITCSTVMMCYCEIMDLVYATLSCADGLNLFISCGLWLCGVAADLLVYWFNLCVIAYNRIWTCGFPCSWFCIMGFIYSLASFLCWVCITRLLSLHSRVCYILPVTFTFPVHLALVCLLVRSNHISIIGFVGVFKPASYSSVWVRFVVSLAGYSCCLIKF